MFSCDADSLSVADIAAAITCVSNSMKMPGQSEAARHRNFLADMIDSRVRWLTTRASAGDMFEQDLVRDALLDLWEGETRWLLDHDGLDEWDLTLSSALGHINLTLSGTDYPRNPVSARLAEAATQIIEDATEIFWEDGTVPTKLHQLGLLQKTAINISHQYRLADTCDDA